jgi:DNA-binding response OmpR family regulator
VDDAPSVAAARTLLREAYDAVLLDVWFPGESGLDLLARSASRRRRPPW